MKQATQATIEQFDRAPDTALVSLAAASIIASRSRTSLYRDNRAGHLPFVKIAGSTRIRVADLRKLIGAK